MALSLKRPYILIQDIIQKFQDFSNTIGINNLSDEKVIKRFLESPYWQYFCGYICFQKEAPLEGSSLARFRESLGEEGAEELLKQTVEAAKRAGLLKKATLKKVIVDTTVQEKNISYPTDAKLINRASERLVKEAKREALSLRQSYKFKGREESVKSSRCFYAKQHKRGRASLKRQKNWLGRVIRDIRGKRSTEALRKADRSFGIRAEDFWAGERRQREAIQFI